MADAEPAELAGEVGALVGGGLGELLAQRFATTCRPGPRGRSRRRRGSASPTSGSSSSRGSRISTASDRGAGWRRRPVAVDQSRGPRKSDTTTTSPPRGAALADELQRGRRRDERRPGPGVVAAAVGSTRAATSAASRPCRPPAGWQPTVVVGRRTWRCRAGCRAGCARWPNASATPSATSALRRSAVPNVIDGETSSSSQQVSARSGTWTRTWGTVVRAVTFQSIWRTSSPGSYGRTWASSVPPPRSWARNSPGDAGRGSAARPSRRARGGAPPASGRDPGLPWCGRGPGRPRAAPAVTR